MATAGIDVQALLDGTYGLPAEQANVIHNVKQTVKTAQIVGACAFAIVLWDSLAYLQQEYRLIWTAKRSLLKVSYLLTRYSTLMVGIVYFIGYFADFHTTSCGRYAKAPPALASIPALGASLVLLARNYTLWDNSTAILAFTLFLAFCQFAGQMTVAVVKTVPFSMATGITTCVPTIDGNDDVFLLYWVFPIVVHLFVAVFSFAKTWEIVSTKDPTASPLTRLAQIVFDKYGQIFPILVIVVELVQIIFFLAAGDMLRAVLAPLSSFLVTVIVCQMVLTMRLTTKSGSNPFSTSSTGANSNSSSLGGKMAVSGIHAIVNSHQAVDVGRDGFHRTPQSETENLGRSRHARVVVAAQMSNGLGDKEKVETDAGDDACSLEKRARKASGQAHAW